MGAANSVVPFFFCCAAGLAKEVRLSSQLGIVGATGAFRLDCLSRGLRPKTLEIYHLWLNRLIEFLSTRDIVACAQVTPNHLRAFFVELNQSSLAPATVNQAFCKCHAFWRWCEAESIIAVSPMARLRAPPVPKKLVPRLSEAQILELLATIDSTAWPVRNRALILLMLDSGLRRGEVVGLQLADVDLVLGCIRVWGKGGRQRAVPIGETTTRALREWTRARGALSRDSLFIDDEGFPLTGDAVRALLRRLKAKLGWQRLGAHLLRHTFATRYLKRGNLKACSQILGHTKIGTTADVYIDFDFDDLKQQHREASPVDHIQR